MTKATAAAEWMHVEQLKPWDRNPVIHDEAGVAELEALIASSVWTAPIVARRSDRRVIAGHGRRALRYAMATLSEADNVAMFHRCGFTVQPVWRALCFAGWALYHG